MGVASERQTEDVVFYVEKLPLLSGVAAGGQFQGRN
jgi:hypothetical protein